jgi:GTP-binding protein
LVDALQPLAGPAALEENEDEPDDAEFSEEDEPDEDLVVNYLDRPLRLALVGRPNVGKSSLFNQLLGEERALTGPEAGLTRDAITAPWKAGDRDVLLHDTAAPAKEGTGGRRNAGGNVGRFHLGRHTLRRLLWW